MHIGNLFSSGRGSFLALAAASTQGGRVYTCRIFGTRAGSVARALSVRSRGELALFAGLFSAQLKPSRSREIPHCHFFHIFTSATVSEVPQQASKATVSTTLQQPRVKIFPLWQPQMLLMRLGVRVCKSSHNRILQQHEPRTQSVSTNREQFQIFSI